MIVKNFSVCIFHGIRKMNNIRPGPEVIKLFSCSTQRRLKFILLINVKMPTMVGILTFISRINYKLKFKYIWAIRVLMSS